MNPLHRRAFAGLALSLLAVSPALAAEPATYTIQGNLAVGGYDAVAFFSDNKPVEGSGAFVTTYKGATYRFASAAHRDLFKADPAKYAPQYGGYCAYAVSRNQLAPGRPQHWAVHKGKLYLNVSANIQKKWNQDRDGNIAKADANWPGVLEKQSGFFNLF
jgi:YHS domain-containing protein